MYFMLNTYIKSGGRAIAGSMFWLFTLYWYVAFPFKAILIVYFDLDLQGTKVFSEASLQLGLVVSYLMWFMIYAGYKHNYEFIVPVKISKGAYLNEVKLELRIIIFVAISILGLFVFLSNFGITINHLSSIENQNSSRAGAGLLFSLTSLLIPSSVIYLSFMVLRKVHFNISPGIVFYSVMFFVSFLLIILGMVQETRRSMGIAVLGGTLALFMINNRYWPLLIFMCMSSIFLSPLLHTLRYALHFMSDSSDWNFLSNAFNLTYFVTNIGSTFEGIDHIAVYINKINWIQFLFGVDMGESWLYNFGGSYIPRLIWESKPLIYGGIKQQEFLYPFMFASTNTPATFPVSFVVDFIYGYGVFFGLLLSYFTGKLLKIGTRLILNPSFNLLSMSITIYTFLYMFNIVRGGTAVVGNTLKFIILVVFVLGLVNTIRFLPRFKK